MEWLKENLGYTSDEVELIRYGLSALLMESSKFIIMLTFFIAINKPFEYLFGTFILLLLRTTTGGLHFSSYIGCLIFSFLTLFWGCYYLPNTIIISNTPMLIALLLCIIVNYAIGPIVSKMRPLPTNQQAKKGKLEAFKIIFFYFIAVFLFPDVHLLLVGFWTIVLQTAQLIIAYFIRKENYLK